MKASKKKLRGMKLLKRVLTVQQRKAILLAGREMARLARDYAIPIAFAPPRGISAKINSATGFGLRLRTGIFIVTAFHVLLDSKKGYLARVRSGERLYWHVGNLEPFEPIGRVAFQDSKRDIVFLRISEREAQMIGPCIISTPSKWPPDPPKIGELVLVGGYPGSLREDMQREALICSGPLTAVLQVSSVNEQFCSCLVEREDLVSFAGPLPDPEEEIGGMSGAPVLRVMDLSYPLVGLISQSVKMGEAEIVQFATLHDIEL